MPIATAITIILIVVYVLLRAASRAGELLLEMFDRPGGDQTKNAGAPTSAATRPEAGDYST